MSVYVLSTMTGAVAYTFYDKGPSGGLPIEKKRIYIHGGAHLPSSTRPFGEHSNDDQGRPLWTPQGVTTTLSDAEYAEIKEHPLFKQHMEAGYLKLVESNAAESHKAVEKAVRQMESADNSAQLTPANAKAKLGKNAPKVRTGDANDEDVDTPKKRIKD